MNDDIYKENINSLTFILAVLIDESDDKMISIPTEKLLEYMHNNDFTIEIAVREEKVILKLNANKNK